MPKKGALDIPLAYRALFLYFEPFAALGGVFLLLFQPTDFLGAMSPSANYAADNQITYDNLAAAYTLFAWNEAILLRMTNDIKVWRGALTGILLCDAIHLYGSWAALGGDVFWDPRNWRMEDWVNLGSLWGQAAFRVAFLAGVGFNVSEAKKRD